MLIASQASEQGVWQYNLKSPGQRTDKPLAMIYPPDKFIFFRDTREGEYMAQGRLRKAVDKSIKAAAENGNIDLNKHAAPIAMLRYMADTLDGDPGETPAIKFVTPASFLNYCSSLGLTPTTESESKETAKKQDGKLEAFKSSSRFAKSPMTESESKETIESQDDFDIEAFRARSRVSRPINKVIM